MDSYEYHLILELTAAFKDALKGSRSDAAMNAQQMNAMKGR